MSNMSLNTFKNIMSTLICSEGRTIKNGKTVYSIFQTDKSECRWVQWLPCEEYLKNYEEYDVSPVGWYALIRLA